MHNNWRRYPSSNWYEIDQKTRFQIWRCCGAIWRHREKPQYRCTTAIHPVYNCGKKILGNLHPVWLLVRTNLFIPSRFWTNDTNFDTCAVTFYICCMLFYSLYVQFLSFSFTVICVDCVFYCLLPSGVLNKINK